MKPLRIALAQINPTVGDLAGNAEKVRDYAVQAAAAGADVVVFPELVISGYPPEDLILKDHFVDDCMAQIHRLAPACRPSSPASSDVRGMTRRRQSPRNLPTMPRW
jgi:NAD+ synthase